MITNFTPLIHGYLFPNRFEKIIKIAGFKNKFIFGLCGGMVFSALDFYFYQKSIPEFRSVQEIDINYTKYLRKRQADSLSIIKILKIFFLAAIPIKRATTITFDRFIPKILDQLNDDLPTPLIIVRSNLLQNPTNNHQVLATGYQENETAIILDIYDPNHPTQSVWLEVIKIQPFQINQSTGEPVRALFLNDYKFKQPVDFLDEAK